MIPAAPPRTSPSILAAVLILGTGCGGPEGPAPRGLAYGTGPEGSSAYTFTETTELEVDAPGAGSMTVQTTREGTAELRFGSASSGGVEVEVRFTRFQGTFRDRSQRVLRTDERDIDGPVRVELDPAGAVVVRESPTLSPALREIATAESLVRRLFVSLPAAPVEPGATWVDTVVVAERAAEPSTRSRAVITSTVASDTLVEGRRLLRIRTRSVTTVETAGSAGGVEVRQSLEGVLTGRVLWDEEAGALVERVESGGLEGTLAMPETGAAPLPVSLEVRRRVVRVP